MTETAPDMRVNCEEVFAPVVTVSPYESWDDAVALINDGPYGLQAGVFTSDIKRVMDAWDRVEVGGLHVNSGLDLSASTTCPTAVSKPPVMGARASNTRLKT